MAYNMNPARGKHLAATAEGHSEVVAGHSSPSIHIHSHDKGHTVHILHKDGTHEAHEHEHGDADGIAEHIHEHLGKGGSIGGHEEAEDAATEY